MKVSAMPTSSASENTQAAPSAIIPAIARYKIAGGSTSSAARNISISKASHAQKIRTWRVAMATATPPAFRHGDISAMALAIWIVQPLTNRGGPGQSSRRRAVGIHG